ncbi:MAG: hypothetical protein HUJ56_05070, partial [Erysipelotrichaceae bacterium]|nr:hypothetical protein [Erysipelotrichaceae bacterium]
MSYLLRCYFNNAIKEIFLPEDNNNYFTYVISKDFSDMREDLHIELSFFEKQWKLLLVEGLGVEEFYDKEIPLNEDNGMLRANYLGDNFVITFEEVSKEYLVF